MDNWLEFTYHKRIGIGCRGTIAIPYRLGNDSPKLGAEKKLIRFTKIVNISSSHGESI